MLPVYFANGLVPRLQSSRWREFGGNAPGDTSTVHILSTDILSTGIAATLDILASNLVHRLLISQRRIRCFANVAVPRLNGAVG